MIKKIFLLIGLIVFLNAETLKDIKFKDVNVTNITSIYDGDTFRANIESYPKIVGYRMAIRVNGIDTPEMRAKCESEKKLARKAKKMTVALLRGAKHIELRNVKRGKYFRLIADVYVDGVSLSNKLLNAGYAVRYSGGTKIDWCR